MSEAPCVIMGDPAYFMVRGGANPHTRTTFGLKKKVSREVAVEQWKSLALALHERGVRIYVIPPIRHCPGLVYPANAGFLYPLSDEKPRSTEAHERQNDKVFCLSRLIPTRAAEQPYYADFISSMGYQTQEPPFRLEGEADFFPWKDFYIFTWGRIMRQRFVPRLGWPPIKRIYGFRSEQSNKNFLEKLHAPGKVLSIELTKEEHYHGDTVLCSFGEGRRFLMLYPEGINPSAYEAVKLEAEEDEIIELSEGDAKIFAANSFYVQKDSGKFLFMPVGVSDELLGQIRERGVEPVLVNVSEFLAKGGGSVKCMILDLGKIDISSLKPDNIEFPESVAFQP